MTDLMISQKKDWAKMLYTKEYLTQQEIADRVGVSRITINKWINAGNWEQLKVSITITKEEQLKNLYRQLQELNESIIKKPEGERYATASEADTITKLANAIKKMETDLSLAEITSAFGGFVNWLRTLNPNPIKEMAPYLDAYVKSKYL
ncbi:helix-turn-helix domain-containing protein [Viscerimonas tarda]